MPTKTEVLSYPFFCADRRVKRCERTHITVKTFFFFFRLPLVLSWSVSFFTLFHYSVLSCFYFLRFSLFFSPLLLFSLFFYLLFYHSLFIFIFLDHFSYIIFNFLPLSLSFLPSPPFLTSLIVYSVESPDKIGARIESFEDAWTRIGAGIFTDNTYSDGLHHRQTRDLKRLQYTCTCLRSPGRNCKIYRRNWGAKRGKPTPKCSTILGFGR